MSNLLTNSRTKTARACLREHYHRYIQLYLPVDNQKTLAFGDAIHAGLEALWLTFKDSQSQNASIALTDVPANAAIESFSSKAKANGLDEFVIAKGEVMLAGYYERWRDEFRNYEVLGVEEEFATNLVNPETGASSRTWVLAGKLDVRVRDFRDGQVKIIEHKTTSEDISPGSEYWKRLTMDSQVSTYFAGAAWLGEPASVCIYDVLLVPAHRPLKATPVESRKYTKDGRLYAAQRENDESPDDYRARVFEAMAAEPLFYFARGEVQRLEEQLKDAASDQWAMGRLIADAEKSGRHPRNPDACRRYGRTCPYFAVCCGEASLDDLTQFYRAESAHPELSRVTQAEKTAKEAEQ